MDILSKFGENLDVLINDNQLEPLTFSEQVDIDSSLIYRYLRKEILPSLPNWLTICDYFACSVDFILGNSVEHSQIKYKKALPFNVCFQAILKEKNLTRYKFLKEAKKRKFNFARQSVDDWFHGKRNPTIDNAIALSKFFDCSLDYLFGRENWKHAPADSCPRAHLIIAFPYRVALGEGGALSR